MASLNIAGLLAVVASLAPGQIIQLSDVASGASNRGFAIDAVAPGDALGVKVGPAGDVNGDGLGDVIVGAYASDPFGRTSGGSAYVVFGKTAPGNVDLSTFPSGSSSAGFAIFGEGNSHTLSLTGAMTAGDVNGDGLADVVLASRIGDNFSRGRGYVVFGKTTVSPVDLTTLSVGGTTLGFAIVGALPSESMGSVASTAGDFNGDGLSDVLLTAYRADPPSLSNAGRAYVVFGRTDTSTVQLSSVVPGGSSLGVAFSGAAAGDYAGQTAACAGDVNGDGLQDIVVASRLADPGGQINAGTVYVVFGKTSTATTSLSTVAAGTGGFAVHGNNPFAPIADFVAGVGDVNGDGLGDIVISHQSADLSTSTSNEGQCIVLFGRTSTTPIQFSDVASGTTSLGFAVTGSVPGGNFPVGGAGAAGDVNGDGLADLVFAHSTSGATVQGRCYVVLGKTSGSNIATSTLETGTSGLGFIIEPESVADFRFVSAAGAGDVNGDGLADLVVGSGRNNNRGTYSGRSYVVYSPYGFAPEAPAASGTYRSLVAAGDADRQGIGTTQFGDDDTVFPDSRAWVDFNGGIGPGPAGSSQVVAKLTRNDSGLTVAVPLSAVADVRWDITTNRTGWSNARLTFQYSNAEIAGLTEANLRLYRAATPEGPWTVLPNQSIDLARNQISGDTSGFSSFILFNQNVLAVDLTSFAASAESASSPVTITWTTAAEYDTAGFHIQSAPASTGPWSRVTSTLIPAEGSAVAGATYSVIDASPIGAGAERWYRLAEVVLDGTTINYDPAQAAVGGNASSVTAWTLY